MKKFVSLGAALMSGAVLAREKPTAFQGTVASHGVVRPKFDLHKPVAVPRKEREDSPVVEKYCTRKERQAIIDPRTGRVKVVEVCIHCEGRECSREYRNRHEKDGTPDERDKGSRRTSIQTDGKPGTSPS